MVPTPSVPGLPVGQSPHSSLAGLALILALLSPIFCLILCGLGYLLTRIPGVGELLGTSDYGPLPLRAQILVVLWCFILPSLPAIVLAIRALLQIGRFPGMTGRGYAIAGLILGFLSVLSNYLVTLISFMMVHGVGHGRRFRVRGKARTAPVVPGRDWASGPRPDTASLDSAARVALAQAWRQDAQAEHASVAAFSRLGLELLAAGVPPRLLESTHQAAVDEIRHAQACFALAGAYAGTDETAGPFPAAVDSARTQQPTSREGWLMVLAIDSLRDGCLGEGFAARAAAEALIHAKDATVRQTLETITLDEADHAELAWQILDWCLEQGGQPIIRALVRELEKLSLPLALNPMDPTVPTEILAAHGRLQPDTLLALRDEVLQTVQVRAWAHPLLQRSRSAPLAPAA